MGVNPKSKTAIVSVCSLLLVAMVVALMFNGQTKDESEGVADLSSSQKAITNLCQNTDYKETCVESLKSPSGKDTTDPKELIERAFQATIDNIKEAAHNSALLEQLENDPRGKSALESCQELADRAAHDLHRSLAKFRDFDLTNIDSIMSDLKIWLSGAITYQETCLDGFEDVQGDAGLKMRQILTKGMEMSSNGLAMVNEISSVFKSFIATASFTSRRLLSDSQIIGHDDDIPDWMEDTRRKLLSLDAAIKPDLVVAKDGSGDFTTVNEALKSVPTFSNTTFVLYIKEGVYEEKVVITSNLTNLFVVGDGPTKTKITGRLNFIDGTNTYQTATVAVQADRFTAKDIGFENSAGADKHQAVALRVSADLALFFNCQMDGYQDTLYAHTYRQFYKDCVISGTIDFVFGDSAAVFQGCTFVVRKPLSNQACIVTAQGRKDIRQPTGLVIQNCSFVSDPEYYPVRNVNKAYLGRPWKEFSRTVIMESFLDDLIQPEGWLPWNLDFALETLFYTEFNNRGPAAAKTGRVTWGGIKELPASRVQRFTADEFIDGKRWIPETNTSYSGGFMFAVPADDPNAKFSVVGPEEDKDMGGSFKNKSDFVTRKIPPPAEVNAPAAAPSNSISVAPDMPYVYETPEALEAEAEAETVEPEPESTYISPSSSVLSPPADSQPSSKGFSFLDFFGLRKFFSGLW